jgi:glutamate---cysteine ligase / carboxylate-amine ligase
MGGETFTIGIEEEYQIIDPESRGLTSYVQEFLDEGRLILQDQIKPEFLQSQIEVGSHICRNIHEAREDLVRLRSAVVELAESKGVQVAAASTHPFSSWLEQKITPASATPSTRRRWPTSPGGCSSSACTFTSGSRTGSC